MKTAIAISPMMRNVLNVAAIPPAAVTANQTARIAPRIVPMIRPMPPSMRPRSLWQAAVVMAVTDRRPCRRRQPASQLVGFAAGRTA
jgi:hypothetical protein